jgi:hypothetical protein
MSNPVWIFKKKSHTETRRKFTDKMNFGWVKNNPLPSNKK